MHSILPGIKQLFSIRMLAVVAKYAEQRYYVPISLRGMKMLSRKTKFLKVIGKYSKDHHMKTSGTYAHYTISNILSIFINVSYI